jgi:hypothetical protein
MIYSRGRRTHFYGAGTADPLREDITLRSLEAKSARLMLMAAARGTACVNLSQGRSRLLFPRAQPGGLAAEGPVAPDGLALERAQTAEASLGYMVPSGRYWTEADRFDAAALDHIDALWLDALAATTAPATVLRREGQ